MDGIKAVGVDPGSKSWDFVCLQGRKSIWEKSISTESVRDGRDELMKELIKLEPSIVAAPSGYGLPLIELQGLDERQRFEIVLKKPGENTVMGLLDFLDGLKETGLKSFILPGVKHLATVPAYRKINRIDMGTPDKVSSVAYSLNHLHEKYDLDFHKQSFIHCELGYSFNAFIAVEEGRIVDGIGGSMSSGGNLCLGFLDSELAYLRGVVAKEDLLINLPLEEKESFLLEAIIRDILRLLPSVSPDYIVYSFREDKPFRDVVREVMDYFKNGPETILIPSKGDTKSAAVGAAMIVNGLVGGEFRELVDVLELRNSSGSVLDYIYPPVDVSGFLP